MSRTMVRTFFVVILSLLVSHLSAQEGDIPGVVRGNFYLSTENITAANLISFYTLTRGRDGINILSITSNKISFSESLNLVFFIRNSQFFVRRLTGNTNVTRTLENPVLMNMTAYPAVLLLDRNQIGWGTFLNDISLLCAINSSEFQDHFGTNFTLFAGYSSSSNIWNSTWFDPSLSETITISSQELLTEKNDPPSSFNRLELVNPAYLAVTLLFYVVVFVLCIIFSQKQPLRSRGAIPCLSVFVQFAYLLTGTTVYASFEQIANACAVIFFLRIPLLISLAVLAILHFFRYLLLQQAARMKNVWTNQSSSEDVKVPLLFKLIQHTGKSFVSMLIMILVYLTLCAIYLIIYAGFGFKCSVLMLSIDVYINYAIYIILVILAVIFLVIDIIANIGSILKCKFWKQDSLFFRLEIYVFLVLFSLGFYIISAILEAVIGPRILARSIVTAIFNTIAFYVLLWAFTLFPLVMTILHYVASRCRKDDKDFLGRILAEEEFRKIFSKFVEGEFSIENLQSYIDIIEFKKCDDPTKRLMFASFFYHNYLNGSLSPLEINISQDLCVQVRKKLDTGVVDKDLFNDVERTVLLNLADTYSRFIFTRDYQVLLAKHEFLKTSNLK